MPSTTHILYVVSVTESPSLSCPGESVSISMHLFPFLSFTERRGELGGFIAPATTSLKYNSTVETEGSLQWRVEDSCLVLLCFKPFLSACMKTREKCLTDLTLRWKEQQIRWVTGSGNRMQISLHS